MYCQFFHKKYWYTAQHTAQANLPGFEESVCFQSQWKLSIAMKKHLNRMTEKCFNSDDSVWFGYKCLEVNKNVTYYFVWVQLILSIK